MTPDRCRACGTSVSSHTVEQAIRCEQIIVEQMRREKAAERKEGAR